jgi:hypothetical protein
LPDTFWIPLDEKVQTMNRKIVSVLVMAAAAGFAFAQDPAAFKDNFVSTMSPEGVQAEFVAFKKSGVNPWSGLYDPLKSFASAKSRAELTADYMAARGEVAALTSEDSGSTWPATAGHQGASNTLAGIR